MNMTDIRRNISHLECKIRHIHVAMRPIAIKMTNIHIKIAPDDSKIRDIRCGIVSRTSEEIPVESESPSLTPYKELFDIHNPFNLNDICKK